ncbi:hypothetical protein JW998_01540 [candidate division KSB1 bacterium]|nr:hypothetical protein [candidate division KSB1 bacterium]
MASTPFDICVLTAANDRQARGFDIQLDWRRQEADLSATAFRIIADPQGRRIGSGGSTFLVLHALYEEFGESLYAKRVLILHSGGDSRRTPAYSAVGKIFMPLPTEKHRTLFDVMLEYYSQLPNASTGQVIIASGDVLLNFDPSFIAFSPTGITGVAFPEQPEEGAYFGVYVPAETRAGFVDAVNILQKPDIARLQEQHAIDDNRRIWLDTGILHLAPDAARTWLACKTLIAAAQKGAINYNLYHEILYAVHGKMDIENSTQLKSLSLFVNCLPYCGFYHIGRSRELLQNFYSLTHAAAHYHFKNSTRSNAALLPELKSIWVYNSVLSARRLSVSKPCLIEGCAIQRDLQLDGHNILTNIPAESSAIHLLPGMCLTVLPLVDGDWVAVLYGIDDQFKGEDVTFLNAPFTSFLRDRGIAEEELWSPGEVDIWAARLFPRSTSPAVAMATVLLLQDRQDLSPWRSSQRLSMQEILQNVDQNRLLEHRAGLERDCRFLTLNEQLTRADFGYSSLTALLRSPADRKIARDQLMLQLQKSSSTALAARLQFWLAQLYRDEGDEQQAERYFDSSFASIRRAVASGLRESKSASPRYGIRSDEVVWTMLPARLDFAGGWTDTPPICLEQGGCVLNASVTLNGQYPIQVVGKLLPDAVIGINSIDLGRRSTIKTRAELADYANPADWLSLPKAAFYAAGVCDGSDDSLQQVLERMGGGIDLTLFSALPAGSGLGTSSILGAGLIATLTRMLGRDISRDELYARTSNLEQLMTTGGGWQDQIGGVAGGVKLITTTAGADQAPSIAWTSLTAPGAEMRERFLLYYTGIRRMAKNLLRHVVGRYLNRDAEALAALDQLAALAKEMKDDLDHRRCEAFGQKIRLAWTLNKILDAGQTTDEIESVLARIDDYMLGAKLLGAGGGGFLFICAKDSTAAGAIRSELSHHPPNDRARFFDFDIDAVGMKMCVL